MKPELVSEERRVELWRERNKKRCDADLGPLNHYDFFVGFLAALEELGVAQVVEVPTTSSCGSNCPWMRQKGEIQGCVHPESYRAKDCALREIGPVLVRAKEKP